MVWSKLTLSGQIYLLDRSMTYRWLLHIFGMPIYMDFTRIIYLQWQDLSFLNGKVGLLFLWDQFMD